jgi:hypothetical protein
LSGNCSIGDKLQVEVEEAVVETQVEEELAL